MIIHRARDIHKCLKGIGSFTGNQAKVVNWDSDHLEWITIQIIPKEGPYCGGKYDFKIIFGRSYPKQPPQVDCITPIYHPNIDMTGEDYNVCLSLFDDWQSSFGLEDVIQGILFLMYYPNLEDPLSPWFDPSMSEKDFKENLQKTLRGQDIEDAINYEFPKMIEGENKMSSEEGDKTKEEITDDSELNVGSLFENAEKEAPTNLESNCDKSEELNSTEDIQTVNTENILLETEGTSVDVACDNNPDSLPDSNENKVNEEKNIDVPTDPEEIAGYIENTFLTGFGELLAIDITDNTSEGSTTSDEDYDDYESFVENDVDSVWSSDDGQELTTANTQRSVTGGLLSFWTRRMANLMHSCVEIYLGPGVFVNNHVHQNNTTLPCDDNDSSDSSDSDTESESHTTEYNVPPLTVLAQRQLSNQINRTSLPSFMSGFEDDYCDDDVDSVDLPHLFDSDTDDTDSDDSRSSSSNSSNCDLCIPSLFDEHQIKDNRTTTERYNDCDKTRTIFTDQYYKDIRNLFLGFVGSYIAFKLARAVLIYVKR